MSDFEVWARWFVLDLTKNSDGEYVSFPTKSALEAWNHQQQKIDAVLNYLSGCECSLDVDIDSIQELLK